MTFRYFQWFLLGVKMTIRGLKNGFKATKKDGAKKRRPKQNGAIKTQVIKRHLNSNKPPCGEYGAIRKAVQRRTPRSARL